MDKTISSNTEAFVREAWEDFLDEEFDLLQADEKAATTDKKVEVPTWSVSTSFKVDSKDVPKLPKDKSVESAFTAWDDSFTVQMQLAKVGALLERVCSVLSLHDAGWKEHEVMDRYFKSCLVLVTLGMTAHAHIDIKKMERQNHLALKRRHQGEDFFTEEATRAANFICWVALWQELSHVEAKCMLKKMDENNTPFPEKLLMNDFLSKIKHPSFVQWVDLMKLTKETDLEVVRREFSKKCKAMFDKVGKDNRSDSQDARKVGNVPKQGKSGDNNLTKEEKDKLNTAKQTGG